jgi:hypothetical protein
MKIQTYTYYNMWYVIPAIAITYETKYYLSIDMIWGKWGISIVIKNK